MASSYAFAPPNVPSGPSRRRGLKVQPHHPIETAELLLPNTMQFTTRRVRSIKKSGGVGSLRQECARAIAPTAPATGSIKNPAAPAVKS